MIVGVPWLLMERPYAIVVGSHDGAGIFVPFRRGRKRRLHDPRTVDALAGYDQTAVATLRATIPFREQRHHS